MQTTRRLLLILSMLAGLLVSSPAESTPEISCGQIIMEDTTLDQDLACPPGTASAIIFGASNITLDLGGHVLSGHTPGFGVFANGYQGITIRNGTIEGFNDGVFVNDADQATLEQLDPR